MLLFLCLLFGSHHNLDGQVQSAAINIQRVKAANQVKQRAHGQVAWAYVDENGTLHHSAGAHVTYPSASTVKAILLVCYLNQYREPQGYAQSYLERMIRYSDNDAASWTARQIDTACPERIARRIGMPTFHYGGLWWGLSQMSADDLAIFFWHLPDLVAQKHYAFDLLNTVTPTQSWSRDTVHGRLLSKGGWLPQSSVGTLLHEGTLACTPKGRVSLGITSVHNQSLLDAQHTATKLGRVILPRQSNCS